MRHSLLAPVLVLCTPPGAQSPTPGQIPLDSPADIAGTDPHLVWSRPGVGFEVAALGDFDGDGLSDLLATGVTVPSSHAILSGADGTLLRRGVGCLTAGGPQAANVGDLDGDGVADVASFGEIDGGSSPLCVVSGATNSPLFEAPFGGPEPESRAVAALALADLDGDGLGDFAVSSGPFDPAIVKFLSGGTGNTLGLLQGGPATAFGHSLGSVPDRTGDGREELVVGAPYAPDPQGVLAVPGLVQIVDPRSGAVLATWIGTRDRGSRGAATAVLDDLDGDGVAELAVSGTEDLAFGDARSRGFVQVLSGADGSAIWEREGSRGDRFGFALEALSDVDGDGVTDLAVGAPGGMTVSEGPGYVRVLSGADGTLLRQLRGEMGVVLFGRSIAALDDVDGDSVADFAVGSLVVTHVFSGKVP